MRCTKAAVVKAVLLAGLCGPAVAEVTVTTLANQGMLVSDGDTRVMVDGLVVEPYSIYGGLTPEAVGLFERLEGPFADVDLVLVSHRHHEHNQPAHACRFMQRSQARLATSAQVIGLMREKCRAFITGSDRVRQIDPQPGRIVRLQAGGARVSVFPLSHGPRKYARIQNYGHLIELGGVRVLHVGDAAIDETGFEQSGVLDGPAPDVALIPFRFFEPGRGLDIVRRYMDAPLKIAVHIPPDELGEVRDWLAEAHPGVRVPGGPLEVFVIDGPAAP